MSKTSEKLAKDIYGRHRDGDFWMISDYTPMLRELGEIVLQVDDADYSGDSRVLYKDGDRYGYLQFGWGSCSGCDALQGCVSWKEIGDLMDELRASIKWFDDRVEALNWFKSHDWESDYSASSEEQAEFVAQVKSMLSPCGHDLELGSGYAVCNVCGKRYD